MAYSALNPPRKIADAGISSAGSLWLYISVDPHTTVDDASYFTNGREVGMKVNDVVLVIDTSAHTTTMHHVTDVVQPAQNPMGLDLVKGQNAAATISAATLA